MFIVSVKCILQGSQKSLVTISVGLRAGAPLLVLLTLLGIFIV